MDLSKYFKKKVKKESKSELVEEIVMYSSNFAPPFNLEGKIVREFMSSVYIEDEETGKCVIRNAGEYELK